MPRLILFTGAPSASSVTSESCTLKEFGESFHSLYELPISGGDEHNRLSQPTHAVWRSLPSTRQALHTGFSQNHHLQDELTHGHFDFFTTADVTSEIDAQSPGENDGSAILTQFCEESLAAHNSTPSSQLDSFELDTTETSFTTASTTENTTAGAMLPPPIPSHLSDLEDVPPPARIINLSPQTVTLNIIVAVISIAQPRTVTTRWGKTMSLVEVLVGDETRSGFAVTFWLSSDQAMASEVSKLRRQDVILMENVALHVFRGKVYGQSLRKNLTRVSLLWRRDGGGYYSVKDLTKRGAAKHPQLEKTRMVKDWVIRFVGRDPSTTTMSRNSRKSWDKPPDDTQ